MCWPLSFYTVHHLPHYKSRYITNIQQHAKLSYSQSEPLVPEWRQRVGLDRGGPDELGRQGSAVGGGQLRVLLRASHSTAAAVSCQLILLLPLTLLAPLLLALLLGRALLPLEAQAKAASRCERSPLS